MAERGKGQEGRLAVSFLVCVEGFAFFRGQCTMAEDFWTYDDHGQFGLWGVR